MYLNTCDGLIIDIRDNGGGFNDKRRDTRATIITFAHTSPDTYPIKTVRDTTTSPSLSLLLRPRRARTHNVGQAYSRAHIERHILRANNFVSIMKYTPG